MCYQENAAWAAKVSNMYFGTNADEMELNRIELNKTNEKHFVRLSKRFSWISIYKTTFEFQTNLPSFHMLIDNNLN